MSNLLEKASILTTPTAYDDGKILSVKPAPSLGSELVTNGDFATDSDWTKQTSWSISGGAANYDFLSDAKYIRQTLLSGGFVAGKVYKINFDITSGTAYMNVSSNGGGLISLNTYSVGSYSIQVTASANGSDLLIYGRNTSGTGFSIDNVSVKEVIDGDFDFTRNSSATRVNAQGLVEDVQILSSNLVQNGDFSQEGSELITNGGFDSDTDWTKLNATISDGKGNLNGDGQTSLLYQNILTQDKFYKVTFTVSDYNEIGTALIINNNGTSYYAITTNGTFTIYFKQTISNGNFLFRATNGAIFSIDNVSVKEVGQDWDLLNDVTSFSFDNGIANIQGTANSANNGIKQASIPAVIGKTYKISATLRSNDGGLYRFRLLDGSYFDLGNGNSSEFETITSYHTATSTVFSVFVTSWFTSGTANFDISNISVIEITDDTNLPRIDYTDGVGSWLFEPQSTNLFTQSELFSDSSWVKSQTIIEAASIVLPNGLTNGYKLFANTTGGTDHRMEKIPYPAATTGQDYTLSLFVKSAGSDFIQIAASTGFPSTYQNFNISTGIKASGDISDSSITDFGNGWYRISVTETTTGTNARYLIVPILSDGVRNPQFAGNADEDGVYIWGAMLEQNSFSTSYIPTNGSTVTRLQDAAFGAGSSDLINSTEGVLYAEIAALADGVGTRTISVSDGTNNNSITIRYTTNSGIVNAFIAAGGFIQFSANISGVSVLDFNKVAIKYSLNDMALWINGVEVATDINGTMPLGLNEINFTRADGANKFFGKTKCLAVFKEALTDEELTCLTTI